LRRRMMRMKMRMNIRMRMGNTKDEEENLEF